jgi:hypothetical protein
VNIDKVSRKIQTPRPIYLLKAELKKVVLTATGYYLKTSLRFTDKALSILYKVSVKEDPDI